MCKCADTFPHRISQTHGSRSWQSGSSRLATLIHIARDGRLRPQRDVGAPPALAHADRLLGALAHHNLRARAAAARTHDAPLAAAVAERPPPALGD
eukprot:103959-Prymnesium_polylepis.1